MAADPLRTAIHCAYARANASRSSGQLDHLCGRRPSSGVDVVVGGGADHTAALIDDAERAPALARALSR